MRDFDPTASEFISTGYVQHSRPGGQYFDPTTAAIGMGGASLVNGIMGSEAASDAADAQRQATAESNAQLQRQYDQTRTDLSPWRSTGSNALERLATMLGLAPGPGASGGVQSYDAIRAELLPQFTKTGTAPQQNGSSPGLWRDNDGHSFFYGDANGEPIGIQSPVAPAQQIDEAGLGAAIQARMAQQQAAQQAPNDPGFGSLLKPFTGQDLQNEPGYAFGLQQGQEALDRKAAAGGNYFSGAALKGAALYAQDYAGTKYNEAFNRDASNKDRAYNYLTGLSTAGQNSAAQTGAQGTQIASQIAGNTSAMGNALGAAAIAGGNAWNGAIQGGINGYQQNQITQALLGGNRGFAGWGSGGGWSGGGRVVPDYVGAEY